jgi:hypothetical protein
MVPLAALNSRPVVGCICADGHYEAACPNLRKPLGQTAGGKCCCTAACCASHGTDAPQHRCCEDSQACPTDSTRSDLSDSGCLTSGGKSCCHPVVQAPVSPTLVKAVQAGDVYDLPALYIASLQAGGYADVLSASQRVDDDTGQPPIDLVVTLRRLII